MILPSNRRGEVSSPKMFLSCTDAISLPELIDVVVFGRGDPAPTLECLLNFILANRSFFKIYYAFWGLYLSKSHFKGFSLMYFLVSYNSFSFLMICS